MRKVRLEALISNAGNHYLRKGADMPNPARDRTEATCRVKPGRNGSLESKHTRQDEEPGIRMERMTKRNRSVTHPALMRAGTHVCLRVLHGGRLFASMGPFGCGCSFTRAATYQKRTPLQRCFSMPTGQRGRTGDRPASSSIVVLISEPRNPQRPLCSRLGQLASDVALWGRRSRSSLSAGKPRTWRRAPVWTPFSVGIAEHDMRNHHA
jgi:hypothetical protein